MTREEATDYWKQRSEHIHNWLEENEDVDFIGEYVEAIDMAIEALQTDEVLCKDCANCLHYDDETENGWLWCTINTHPTAPKDFCSFGERKGGGSE